MAQNGIRNGQDVDETNSNAAWLMKGDDGDTTTGPLGLNSAAAIHGTGITSAQRELNAIWHFLGGLVNQVKTYLPTWTNNQGFTSTDTVRDRADALTAKLHGTLGHTHSGAAGDAPKINTSNIEGYPLRGAYVRGTDIASPSGTSVTVTGTLNGKTPSNNSTTKGVPVNSPYNEAVIKRLSGSEADSMLEDALGNIVFGRITESGGVWTMSFYSDQSGVETAYTMTAADTAAGIKWYYVELFNPLVDLPVYPELTFIPSDNYTQDILDASATQSGKVNTGTQSFAGVKTFLAGADMNSQKITNLADPTNPQDAATKAHVASALATLQAFNKNRLINGCMRVDQRYGGTAHTMSGSKYCLDRWSYFTSNGGTATVQQVDSPIAGFAKAMKITVTSADASVGAGDYLGFTQNIEGLNVADLKLGTASAQNFTVSFYVRANHTGTYSLVLLNSGLARSYVTNFSIAAINTDYRITLTIPGDQAGTWLTTNGLGLAVRIGLMSGTTYQKTANQWNSGDCVGTSSTSNFMGTNGNAIWFTGFQLEAGSAATPFETQLIDHVVRSCQRYYYKICDGLEDTATGSSEMAAVFGSNAPGGVFYGNTVFFPVEMRATPTLKIWSYGGVAGQWNYGILGVSEASVAFSTTALNRKCFRLQTSGNVASTQNACYGAYSVNAEL